MGDLYNLDYLREISQDDLFIKDMIRTFIYDAPQNFYKLKRHFINRNFFKIAEVTHEFKNAASFIGNEKLIAVLADLEYSITIPNETMRIRNNINQIDLLVHDIISKLKNDFKIR